MIQVKMKYGIDLGTTNSAICKLENGSTIIKKTDTLKDTLPSCVSFTKKRVVKAGDGAMNDLKSDKSRMTKKWGNSGSNVFIEFKRTMGLDTQYRSSNMEKDFNSEDLSAEILKALKSFVSDDNITAAVITIPAKFKSDQIAATKRAATLAGITSCELLQEPIAASMAYGLSSDKKDGIWLVFDFGGGTFDVALLKVEDGIMQVIDTEGDNYLGGKNLDYAIVDEIIIPYLKEEYVINNILSDSNRKEILRDAMKFYAEQAKNQLSFNEQADITSQLDEFGEDDEGTELELDLIITREELKAVLSPIFQKAIDICKQLLQRNNISNDKLDSLILVGGPTYSPILREMLKEQITTNVDTSIDPMTAVAKGAALYASGIVDDTEIKLEMGSIALDVKYESNTVETQEYVTVKLLPNSCTGNVPEKMLVEIVRSDKGWSSGKIEINATGDVIECLLQDGKANSFNIISYDDAGNTLPCFPNEFTIIQGTKVGSAVLPYNIGIEVRDTTQEKDIFMSLKGLEKNKPLPAVGVRNGLKTPKQIRPGVENDRLVIPIYLGEYNVDGSNAINNDHVTDVIINGDDVPTLVPADSDIDITINVDRSQLLTVEVQFIAIGESIEKEINIEQRTAISANELMVRMKEAKKTISKLESSGAIPKSEIAEANKMVNDVSNRFDGEKSSDDGRLHLLADLRRAFIEMERVEKKYEWESIENELKEEFRRLEKANDELGNEHDAEVDELRKQTDVAIRKGDVNIAREVLKNIKLVFFQVSFIYQLMGFIERHLKNFNNYPWKDANRARQLLTQGAEMIQNSPTVENLHPVVIAVIELLDMPESDKPTFP
ncbi:MAG: Hsp70 family protein [bacterium]